MQVHQALRPSIQLELFPKSTIDVFITVLEVDGEESCIASASIAASAALADAGFEMFGLVAACSACTFPVPSAPNDMDVDVDGGEAKTLEDVEIWLDPSAKESSHASGSLVMTCMPALGTVTNVQQIGVMTTATAGKVRISAFYRKILEAQGVRSVQCLDLCLERCTDIHGVMAQALLEAARAKPAPSDMTAASFKP
jgi:exosome complex component MTR3